MKSFKRLGIDPLVVNGTLCVKCPTAEPALAAEECVARPLEELAIVSPRILVVMGEPALETVNRLGVSLARPSEPREGGSQAFPPPAEPRHVADLDEAPPERGAK